MKFFLAGLSLENYIQKDLSNVTLTVLEGEVVYEIEDEDYLQSLGVKLKKGESTQVDVGIFHRIHTVSSTPSCYMYTFVRNSTVEDEEPINRSFYSPFPVFEDVPLRINAFLRMWKHIFCSVYHILFSS